MSKSWLWGVALAGSVLVPLVTYGATFRVGQDYYLDPGSRVSGNLYTAGSDVNISGRVAGDLMTAGGSVLLSGQVDQDVAAVGGTVISSSVTSGDVRLLGGNISVQNQIGGDLVVVGGQISALPQSFVSGDAHLVGGQINYAGTVGGDLVIAGGTVYLNGTVGGNLRIKADKIKLGPGAKITGNFNYSSPTEASLDSAAQVHGATHFDRLEKPAAGTPAPSKFMFGLFAGLMTLFWLVKSAMVLTLALVLLYACRPQVTSIINHASKDLWSSVGYGFIFMVVTPVAIILSFVTVIGIPLGILAGLFYALVMLLTSAISVLLFATLSAHYVFKRKDFVLNWWSVLISLVVLSLLSVVPLVGWLFTLIIFLAALGQTAGWLYSRLRA